MADLDEVNIEEKAVTQALALGIVPAVSKALTPVGQRFGSQWDRAKSLWSTYGAVILAFLNVLDHWVDGITGYIRANDFLGNPDDVVYGELTLVFVVIATFASFCVAWSRSKRKDHPDKAMHRGIAFGCLIGAGPLLALYGRYGDTMDVLQGTEALFEAGPQLVLQTYILVDKRYGQQDSARLKNWAWAWQLLLALKSLVSYGMYFFTQFSKKKKPNLSDYKSYLFFAWVVFMFLSSVVRFSVLSSNVEGWTALCMLVYGVVSLLALFYPRVCRAFQRHHAATVPGASAAPPPPTTLGVTICSTFCTLLTFIYLLVVSAIFAAVITGTGILPVVAHLRPVFRPFGDQHLDFSHLASHRTLLCFWEGSITLAAGLAAFLVPSSGVHSVCTSEDSERYKNGECFGLGPPIVLGLAFIGMAALSYWTRDTVITGADRQANADDDPATDKPGAKDGVAESKTTSAPHDVAVAPSGGSPTSGEAPPAPQIV